MNNKTLRRILNKTLSFQSMEELVSFIDEVAADLKAPETSEKFQTFKQNLQSCFESLDKAITDLDRVIDIRDRSLAISSKEMVALNAEISEQARMQKEVLDRLRALLLLLREGKEASSTEDSGLDELVTSVDGLVKRQINSARDLKLLFEEGLRISSAMNFKALESQFQISISNVLEAPADVKMYFAASLFGLAEETAFYSCNEMNGPGDALNLDDSPGANFQTIDSTKGAGTLAFVRLGFGASAKESGYYLPRIQPLFPSVAATLENIRLLQEEKHRQRLESELQTARFVQVALLPPASSTIVQDRLEISGFYQNASECGGDWWSHYRMPDGRELVFLGDVTGHGTASAMVCAVVKGYCDSFVSRRELKLAAMLEELNRVVFRINREAGRAMTMVALAIDVEKEELTFCNAGHPAPILLRSSNPDGATNRVQYLINSGHILGLTESVKFTEKVYPFRNGEQIVLYSDGLIEYLSHDRSIYGDQRLRRCLSAAGDDLSASETNRVILNDLRDFALGEDPRDDITTVVIKSLTVEGQVQAANQAM